MSQSRLGERRAASPFPKRCKCFIRGTHRHHRVSEFVRNRDLIAAVFANQQMLLDARELARVGDLAEGVTVQQNVIRMVHARIGLMHPLLLA